jgi:hypothetical protein
MLYIDPLAIVLGLVLLVVFVLAGSRFFPKHERIDMFRYHGSDDRSAGIREDDDAVFRWDRGEREDPPDR